ncbi:HDOD domain-containing protein [Rhodoferax mekongensis]|uniref:HDOD domain-containing protein n=1 Tax=Rhodoferax mekongensis TaxID=3068341 RepID=A0ABZ0AZ51_9BURK|nr:HDOD domain-containing protein [Rhodoferax sp. TBRC 17307]WNO04927.1 HDOD domain-containing protein [Rhodoferax sp. TBRC 17307]
MSSSVLGSVTIGYEPVWDQWRKRIGVRLWLDPESSSAVDANHLILALQELWPASREVCLLHAQAPGLLADLLEHCNASNIWLEIPQAWLGNALLAGRVRKAQQRGVKLVWAGEPGERPAEASAGWFHSAMLSLTAQDALGALRAALRKSHDGGSHGSRHTDSPVLSGQLYESLASQALVEHALDQQHVRGVAGWPTEEMLYAYRYRQIQPARQALLDLVHAIDADESLEALEHTMGNEPLLCYRFLRYANSASLSLRSEVTSLRQGLMTLGYSRLRAWLMEQLPHASADTNLDPIRHTMVLRARIMERLADAGVEDDLRREVFLCGVFSQVDLLLGENLGAALHRLPLPGRVSSAVVGHTGPYAPWLEVASALEGHNTKVIRDVCRAHQIASDEVNRALLRSLAQQ